MRNTWTLRAHWCCRPSFDWVEGEIEELEEADPLSAQHKRIKKLVKERAAQHERNEQLFTKNSVIAIFRHEDQTRGL